MNTPHARHARQDEQRVLTQDEVARRQRLSSQDTQPMQAGDLPELDSASSDSTPSKRADHARRRSTSRPSASPPGRGPSMRRRSRGRSIAWATIATFVVSAFAVVSIGGAAQARVPNAPPINGLPGPNTDLIMTGTGAGSTVRGFQPPTPITQDPTAPYPGSNPPGYTPVTTFAGIITTQSVSDEDLTGEMYCINIRVTTQQGIGYEESPWEESTVPNVGHVAYILNNYYPNVAAPAGLNTDQQAAAVQAAIWYFTDGFVLGTTGPGSNLRSAVAAIVADAQQNGPVTEPDPPNLSIDAAGTSVPVGQLAGPFTINTDAAEVTVSIPFDRNATLYADAEGTMALENPATIAAGTQVWVSRTGTDPAEVLLAARAAVTVQRGQVYVYDGNAGSAITDAQRLILAATTELDTTAAPTAEFFAVGSLEVSKTLAGEAVGEQGAAQLAISCGEGYEFTADIPAGATTTQTFTFDGIPVDNTCVITEPTTGATTAVLVTTDAPQEVVMPDGGTSVTISNTYTFAPGGLVFTKTITGSQAGEQGEIVIAVDCGEALQDTVAIPAGSAAGDYTNTYTDLPAGTECTITDTQSGSTTTVEVVTDGPAEVTIEPGETATATLTNTATFRPGSLEVAKVITGPAAGLQGVIEVSIDCGDALQETLTIPAGSAAGDYREVFEEIPAGTTCTVSETLTGANSLVTVASDGPVAVTIAPVEVSEAVLTNTVTGVGVLDIPVVGALAVTGLLAVNSPVAFPLALAASLLGLAFAAYGASRRRELVAEGSLLE